MFDRIRQLVNEPVSDRWVNPLVGFALFVWTFGQIVFVHSNVSLLPFVVDNGIAQFHQAITVGCLVAALACRGMDFRPMGVVGLFCALFAALTVWRQAHDPHLIVMLLLVIAAKDMDVSVLARRYVYGAFVGLLVVCVCVLCGAVSKNAFVVQDSLVAAYGFRNVMYVPCLLFSLPMGILMGMRDAKLWRYVIAACLAGALVEALLGAVVLAILLLLLAGGAFVRETRPGLWLRAMRGPSWRWLVALLPLALFCLCNDGAKFFGFPAMSGALTGVLGTYGYGACACFAVLYVRSVLLMDSSGRSFTAMTCCVVCAVALLYVKPTINLEFNCVYLVLVYGVSGSSRLMPGLAYDTMGTAQARDRGAR